MFDIERGVSTGEAYKLDDLEIIPQTQYIKVQTPGHHFGFLWNRPRSVIVRTADGQETTMPVTDVTRNIIWGMLAGGIIGAMLIGIMYRINEMGNQTKE